METNPYRAAIRVIADKTYDAEEVAISLAQKNPELFMECVGEDSVLNQKWQRAALKWIRADQSMRAIKEVREITGWSLKECKEAVDKLKEDFSYLLV